MISILIAMYNVDVGDLIQDVIDSCAYIDQAYEIAVIDDASPDASAFDRLRLRYRDRDNVHIRRHAENQGRARTRNLLADRSNGDWLLFIDGDCRIVDITHFMSNYESKSNSGVDAIFGGHVYDSQKPMDTQLYLHWHYGRTRESVDLKTRQSEPCRYTFASNVFIRSAMMRATPFDEQVVSYGYEDILWGEQLRHNGCRMLMMDNTVLHCGLASNQVFLDRVDEAMQTLVRWSMRDPNPPVKLWRVYRDLQRLWWGKAFLGLCVSTKSWMKSTLLHNKGTFILYDCYRIAILHRLVSSEQEG